ncbi:MULTISPECIES: magnesium and cobalt transport protein CorA [Thermocrispum]|jgi:magnesium transporter|uniref:Magnesium and cobalt transport protein CorA n=1 Tax=Thermocrispum agreste TaxID=37925 RepID=A0A2W4LIR9_9PSEU|nr:MULTISPECIES: magnesium and cobalt transport protein CorA [Thermocrispum]PZM97523.1 MAG: magnesium and cobalt transport protein CorA [Thermocrispum agreste]
MPAIPSLSALRSRARTVHGPVKPRATSPLDSCIVDCAVYVDGRRKPGRWTHTDAIAEVRATGEGFVWLGLYEPAEEQMAAIARTFELHELAVEDAVQAHQRPKLDRYEDTLFMVFKTVRYVEHSSPTTANEIVATGELMAFLGKDFIITVRHGEHAELGQVRKQLEDDPEQLALGPSAVLHAIADHVVDDYMTVTDGLAEDVDTLETEVFAPDSLVTAEQIYFMKREVLELRRAVLPLATPLRRLAQGYSKLVPDQVRSYFSDVDDHLTTVSERVAGFDEMLTTLVDATLAKITLQQNTDMRKITAWAAIIAVPTAIAGIYGMNFDFMPETHWRYGYPAVLLLIAVVCLTLYFRLRRNRWL